MARVTRILCPVDFSDTSNFGFDYADDFAGNVGASIIVAHAFSIPEGYYIGAQNDPAHDELNDQLLKFDSRHEDVVVSHVLHQGPPGQVICWFAEDLNCDLIIMGSHGRTGIRRALLGSTAEYVLRHARCPVLTVRPKEKDAKPLAEPMLSGIPHRPVI